MRGGGLRLFAVGTRCRTSAIDALGVARPRQAEKTLVREPTTPPLVLAFFIVACLPPVEPLRRVGFWSMRRSRHIPFSTRTEYRWWCLSIATRRSSRERWAHHGVTGMRRNTRLQPQGVGSMQLETVSSLCLPPFLVARCRTGKSREEDPAQTPPGCHDGGDRDGRSKGTDEPPPLLPGTPP